MSVVFICSNTLDRVYLINTSYIDKIEILHSFGFSSLWENNDTFSHTIAQWLPIIDVLDVRRFYAGTVFLALLWDGMLDFSGQLLSFGRLYLFLTKGFSASTVWQLRVTSIHFVWEILPFFSFSLPRWTWNRLWSKDVAARKTNCCLDRWIAVWRTVPFPDSPAQCGENFEREKKKSHLLAWIFKNLGD